MADQATILQLVLNKLGLGSSITTMDERIAIQKVVCLTQEAGLQLGYGFNWYVRGPYSPALASDYYQLEGMRQTVEGEAKHFVLTDAASQAVNKVSAIMAVPANVHLSRVQWLELAASIVFLKRRHKLSTDAAKKKIETSKPLLHPYFDISLQSMVNAGFVLE